MNPVLASELKHFEILKLEERIAPSGCGGCGWNPCHGGLLDADVYANARIGGCGCSLLDVDAYVRLDLF